MLYNAVKQFKKKTAMRTLICCNRLKLGILLTCINGFIEHNRSSKQRLIIDLWMQVYRRKYFLRFNA